MLTPKKPVAVRLRAVWISNLCPTYYVIRPSGFRPEEGSVWTVKERTATPIMCIDRALSN